MAIHPIVDPDDGNALANLTHNHTLAVSTAPAANGQCRVSSLHFAWQFVITLPKATDEAALCVVGTLFLVGLPGGIHVGLLSALLSVLLVVGAAYAVWSLSGRGRVDVADRVPVGVRDRAVRGFGVDTAYVGVGRAVTATARLVVTLDRDVVDAYPRATAAVVRGLGRVGDRAHRGVPSAALVALLVGAVAVAVLGVAAWR